MSINDTMMSLEDDSLRDTFQETEDNWGEDAGGAAQDVNFEHVFEQKLPQKRQHEKVQFTWNGSSTPLLSQLEYEELLGEGGFGKVYKGKLQPLTQQPQQQQSLTVAIKVAHSSSISSLERELEKFRVLGSHPYIIDLLGMFERNPVVDDEHNGNSSREMGLVIEFARFGSLHDVVERKGIALPWTMVLSWLSQVNSALQHIHHKDQLHLDVKPANMLLTESLEIRLIDFGTTRSLDSCSNGYTELYCAPERYIYGQRATSASDVFSLGISGFHLLTLQEPMGPYEQLEYFYESAIRRSVWFSAVQPLLSILRKCLSSRPADRLTCDELELQLLIVASTQDYNDCLIAKVELLSFLEYSTPKQSVASE
jgi:serine/threonine protein kinase